MEPPRNSRNSVPSTARRIDRRRLLRGASAALGLALAPGLLTRDTLASRPATGAALRFFDNLALMRGQSSGAARPGWVRKWMGPVAVRLVGDVEPPALSGAAHVLDALCRWSGLEFALALGRAPAGNVVTIDVMNHQRLIERYGGPVCMTSTYGNGGVLHTGHVEVSERYADCLRHELMHAIGFDNHWPGTAGAMPSVLAPRYSAARAADFSPWDELAIRALYDPRLEPGMPRHIALPLAARIVEELLDA